MQVHICSPYDPDKNLGKAYNETMRLLPDDWWACFHDIDTTFLSPDGPRIIYEYVRQNQDGGILTCYTNRVSPLSRKQMIGGVISDNADMLYHLRLAQTQMRFLYTTSEIKRDISGMLMVISKRTWLENHFTEDRKCLGVDTEYNRRIRAAGLKILRMNGLYIFHTYRLLNGIYHKKHLE